MKDLCQTLSWLGPVTSWSFRLLAGNLFQAYNSCKTATVTSLCYVKITGCCPQLPYRHTGDIPVRQTPKTDLHKC